MAKNEDIIVCCYKKKMVRVILKAKIEDAKTEAVKAFKYIGVEIPPINDLNFYVAIGERSVYISKDAWFPKTNDLVYLESKSKCHERLRRLFKLSNTGGTATGGTDTGGTATGGTDTRMVDNS